MLTSIVNAAALVVRGFLIFKGFFGRISCLFRV